MSVHLLAIGLNYAGTNNALRGCVNDAQAWMQQFGPIAQSQFMLTETEATKAGIVSAIAHTLSKLAAGDTAIITYSGHGTYIPDQSGDETDRRDEALCPYDLNKNLLLDDELRDLLSQRAAGSRVLLITDCCHSGTMTRDVGLDTPDLSGLPRYVPFAELTECMCAETVDRITSQARAARSIEAPVDQTDLIHLAGCRDDQVSYDATIGGKACGAFTYFAIKALQARQSKGLTFAEWRDAVTPARLPSAQYPQSPVFNGPLSLIVPGFELDLPQTQSPGSQVFAGKLDDGRKFELRIG